MREFKPYDIVLEERPDWWKVRLPEIAEELGLSKGSIKRAKKALEQDMNAIISKKKAIIAENGWGLYRSRISL